MAEQGMGDVALLLDLMRQVRRETCRTLQAVPVAALTWTPAGLHNPPLWHAGHALWLQDLYAIQPLTGRSELPDGWVERFAEGSQPATVEAWPERAMVAEALAAQHRQAEALLTAAGGDEPGAAQVAGQPWRRFASGLIHGLHDEARHQGQLYLLIKMYRAAHR